MKFLSMTLMVALLISCSESKPKEKQEPESDTTKLNDLARYGYHGNVKQIIMKKYMFYDGNLDSSNFNFRTLYDYNKEGNVEFMQFVMNRSMYDEQSIAIDYYYTSENARKTGWTEIRLNEGDTSKGSIEWIDDRHIQEIKYISGTNQMAYSILTEIDLSSGIEKNAEIKQYAEQAVMANQFISNITLENGDPNYRVYQDKTSGAMDTVWVEILERDDHGNTTALLERSGDSTQTLILKEFKYYQ
ncbi:MAG: hypothetical protein GC180_05800 [Bacteroidetes bacterium]|nr:hypothetical protein [Bacteroidota bacterium]